MFFDIANEAIRQRGTFSIALSGGSTPKKLYEAIVQAKEAQELDWTRVLLFWGDERAVSPDHADSNYRMAMESFSKPPLSQAKAFRMQAEQSDCDAAARSYEASIRNANGGIFDLILLGLGEDGHTASLFPESSALKIQDRLVTCTFVPSKETMRMTLTYPCINQARHVIFLVTGKSKKEILNDVLFGQDQTRYPSQKIRKKAPPVLFIVDHDARS